MILIKIVDRSLEERYETNFEYDIQSLVRAFYFGKKIEVNKPLQDAHQILIEVEYIDNSVGVNIFDQQYGGKMQLRKHDDGPMESENRQKAKNQVKRLLYVTLCDYTGKKLPWGTLTGIRPIKQPLDMLLDGRNGEFIRHYMKNTYLMSDEKLNLAMKVANKEYGQISKFPFKEGYSLYVGIPFCPTICAYCSFSSYPLAQYAKLVDAYLDALEQELRFVAGCYQNKPLQTIYIGGGTPTTLTAAQLTRLVDLLHHYFVFDDLLEFTVEAGRPDSITRDKLVALKEGGVTRISINPQTLKEDTLKIIGRKHTIAQFQEAYKLAREVGFDNINMDFILGLPEESAEDIYKTMEGAFLLDPESITIHSLALKRAARLNTEKHDFSEYHFLQDGSVMEQVQKQMESHGYEPYYLYRQKNIATNLENVGYGKPGKECIYNILMMEEKHTVIAVGAGAVSKFVFPDGQRVDKVDNVKDVTTYINRIEDMIQRKYDFFQENARIYNAAANVQEELPELIFHGIAVSNLAYEIAGKMGLPEETRYNLAVAGILHDIGKLKLHRYMNGEQSLQIERMNYMRMHSTFSYEILKGEGYSDFILDSVRYHHENYDGSGFPKHLAGEQIPLGARILRVCDVFVALTSRRGYREAFDWETALSLMIDEVKNFDMEVFIAFQRVINEHKVKQ
jgi:oxygen-independent coproporphyrinogen-3 oxidase